MTRDLFLRISGIAAAVLLATGSVLYAINSPHRSLANGIFAAGLIALLVFTVPNAGVIRSFFGKRSSKYGANMLVMVILFTCIITIIQTLAVRHNKRFDLTSNARFTLASQTLNVLRTLGDDITITAFYKSSGQDRLQAEDLLSQYAYQCGRIHYEFVDPDRKPQLARTMGVANYGTTVVACGGKNEMLEDLNEETLTNAILKVSRKTVKSIYFLKGHGEKDPYGTENIGFSIMRQAIEKEGYAVHLLSLFEEETVPEDASIVIVAGPAQDLFGSDVEKLTAYLARGGNAIFMLDPLTATPNIETLIETYGLTVDDDIIIDPFSRVFGGEYTIPVVTQYVEHPITRGFTVATFYPGARSVRMTGEPGPFNVQYLAQTGKSAWGEMDLEAYRNGTAVRDESDIQPPVPLAAISERGMESTDSTGAATHSQIVVIGDSECAANASFHVSGNGDFIMNIINFLAEEKDLISIRPKQGMGDQLFLTASQGRLVFLLCVILLPLAIITLGSTFYVRRRRRG